jgi:hypothetical protein
MGPDTQDTSKYVEWLMYALLSRTERSRKNLVHDRQFPTQDAMQAVMDSAAFEWAPGLLTAIKSDKPPTTTYFKSLPMKPDSWAIYVLVLEKPGTRARVYISSGTSAGQGIP